VDFHAVKAEKMKTSLIEAIETIREGRSIPLSENPPAGWLIRMNTFWKSKMEEARARGDLEELRRAKQEREALDTFYGKPPIIPKAGSETEDVSKIDLVALYGDTVQPYLERKGEKYPLAPSIRIPNDSV